MTTERHAWSTLHPLDPSHHREETCSCGQELDLCTGRHCPRCGTSIAHAA